MKRVSFALLVYLLVQQLSFSAPGPVIISEFMAFNTVSNANTVLDDFRQLSDWIELRNTSNGPVNLENWALTDDPNHDAVWRFPATNLNAGAFMIVFASGRNRAIPGAVLHTDFRLNGDGDYLALLDPNGNVVTEFAPEYPPQVGNVSYGFGVVATNLPLVTTNGAVRVRVPASSSDGTNWAYAEYDDSSWTAGNNGVGFSAANNAAVAPFVRTDVSATMSNINASVYLRYAFNIVDPTNIALLTLRLRYDDGFVVWVNGVELARANAPDPLAFNSAATNAHSPGTVEELRLGVANNLLHPGANVLAIQGLNVSASDVDFLVQAELTGLTYLEESSVPSYFVQPTPGQPNVGGSGTNAIGPLITDVVHTPNVPLDADDLIVTARVAQTLNAVTNVTLQYRVMFGANVPLPMFDDGTHGDAAGGDGIYTAVIPASASTNGQMVRYFIQARDLQGNGSRFPLFTSQAETAEYLGTVVNGEGVVSKLPVLHLFVNSTQQAAVDSQAGGKASAYHDGEFYDNISMQVRGNTTAGYLKKSHRLEFNREHPLRHPGPGPRIQKTSFVAEYPDPTYLRQRLAFWLCEVLGSPAPFYYPMRLQLNGDFYQLVNHNDVHGEELLSRLGYDPNGALYNAAGNVVVSQNSTGGFEKKTRKFENNADYTAMAGSIAETVNLGTRTTNVFEQFDIPNMLDYLVAARWSHENDDVWANMSLYHDNDGDGLWRIIAFDMNLSWGAIYYEGNTPSVIEGVQATNDIHKAHPLYGSSFTPALSGPGAPNNFNRVYEAFFAIPQLREMFLRRTRTMLDTYMLPPDTHPLAFTMEKQILQWRDLIAEEANRDRDKWGWPAKGGQCNFDPGIRLTNGVAAMISDFVVKRRIHYYVTHSVTNNRPGFVVGITKTNNAGIPLPQPADARIDIAGVEYNPASGNQAQEFICITNPNNYAVDMSNWQLGGGVDFTFHPGTVLPANSVAYVSPDLKAFRGRTTGPRGGQALLVVGPYKGQLSARGESLYLLDQKGRGVSTNSYPGTPSLAQQFLRITEIMYNPSGFGLGLLEDPQNFEYLELKNISSSTTLELTGVRFVNGVTFNFTGSQVTSLAPGARVLVVRDTAKFAARYGNGLPVAGQYTGNLENNGERLTLVDATGEEILDFDYENDWYPITDGAGFSLAIVDESAEPDLWNRKTNWRPSGGVNGAPGQPDPAPPVVPAILITEVLSHTDPPAKDTVELFNPTEAPVNIAGWYLSDDFGTPRKFKIPDVTIPAHGYVTFNEDQFNTPTNAPTSFALSSKGDEIYLFSGNGTDLTGYVQGYSFGAAENGVSFGRYLTSQTNVHFVAQSALTLGSANAGPKVGPVVIAEIMYHPPDLPGGKDDTDNEYIELRNISSSPVPLFNAGNSWRLRGGVDFVLPPNLSLAPGASLVVVNFNPNHVDDAAKAAAFRSRYGISASVPLAGPYGGKLNNDSDNIRLERPDTPEAQEIPYILVDRVEYRDDGAWPAGADGTGSALHRIALDQYGNDPSNWRTGAPNPGSAPAAVPAPTIITQPASTSGLATLSASFSVVPGGTGPFHYQWRFNGVNIDAAITSTLELNNLQLEQSGLYSVVVYNNGGTVLSSEATLNVLLPAFFLTQPQSVNLRGSTNNADYGYTTNNASFSATAKGVGTLHYQWRFNGQDIPGANGTTYAINGVQLTNDGTYDVIVTDDVGSIPSTSARLKVLVPPTVLLAPLSQSVPSNATFTASVVVRGNPPPFRYEWREISTIRGSNTTAEATNFFTSLPITNITSRQWRLVIFNEANPSPGLLAAFNVIAVADTDGDGIPDAVDLNPTSNVDRTQDFDGDGVSNYNEYIAGTDQTDAQSYLKVLRLNVGTGAEVVWQALSNKTYTVQYTDDLGTGTWSKLADVVAASNNREVSVSDPNFTTNRFYRLTTPQH
jgi:hypothetical protein